MKFFGRQNEIKEGSSQILVHNAQLQNSLRKFYIKC